MFFEALLLLLLPRGIPKVGFLSRGPVSRPALMIRCQGPIPASVCGVPEFSSRPVNRPSVELHRSLIIAAVFRCDIGSDNEARHFSISSVYPACSAPHPLRVRPPSQCPSTTLLLRGQTSVKYISEPARVSASRVPFSVCEQSWECLTLASAACDRGKGRAAVQLIATEDCCPAAGIDILTISRP